MSYDRGKCERLMKVCQKGYPASNIHVEYANNTLAECYGVIGSLIGDNDASSDLLRKLSAELECARGDLRQAMQIVERDQKDAERYRWLRDGAHADDIESTDGTPYVGSNGEGGYAYQGVSLDHLVDTDMQKAKP